MSTLCLPNTLHWFYYLLYKKWKNLHKGLIIIYFPGFGFLTKWPTVQNIMNLSSDWGWFYHQIWAKCVTFCDRWRDNMTSLLRTSSSRSSKKTPDAFQRLSWTQPLVVMQVMTPSDVLIEPQNVSQRRSGRVVGCLTSTHVFTVPSRTNCQHWFLLTWP